MSWPIKLHAHITANSYIYLQQLHMQVCTYLYLNDLGSMKSSRRFSSGTMMSIWKWNLHQVVTICCSTWQDTEMIREDIYP